MEKEKKRVYISLLNEDYVQLVEEANYLGVSKTNYIYLILYLNRNNEMLIEDLQNHKALIDNNANEKQSLYLNLSAYLSSLHANKYRSIYSFNQYLSTVIHVHLKKNTLPRLDKKRPTIRTGFTVPTQIPEKFDEILSKTSIFSKTLITYTLATTEIEYHKRQRATTDMQKMYLQYPVDFDKFMPNDKYQKIELLEYILEEYSDILG